MLVAGCNLCRHRSQSGHCSEAGSNHARADPGDARLDPSQVPVEVRGARDRGSPAVAPVGGRVCRDSRLHGGFVCARLRAPGWKSRESADRCRPVARASQAVRARSHGGWLRSGGAARRQVPRIPDRRDLLRGCRCSRGDATFGSGEGVRLAALPGPGDRWPLAARRSEPRGAHGRGASTDEGPASRREARAAGGDGSGRFRRARR